MTPLLWPVQSRVVNAIEVQVCFPSVGHTMPYVAGKGRITDGALPSSHPSPCATVDVYVILIDRLFPSALQGEAAVYTIRSGAK